MIIFGNDENIPAIVEELNHHDNIIATFPEFHQKFILEEYKKKKNYCIFFSNFMI